MTALNICAAFCTGYCFLIEDGSALDRYFGSPSLFVRFTGSLCVPSAPWPAPLEDSLVPLELLVPSPPLEEPAVALSPLVPMLSPVPVAPPVEPMPSQRGLSLLLPLVPVASSGPEDALLPLEEPLEVTAPSPCPDTPGVGAPPALPIERVEALSEREPEVPGLTTASSPLRGAGCVSESADDDAPDEDSGETSGVVVAAGEAASSASDLGCAVETGPAVIKDKKTAKENLFMLTPGE